MSTNTKNFKSSTKERKYRRFSTEFKQKRVREIEQGRTTVSQICKAYEVSDTSVYKWISKYSSMEKPHRTIVESKSDSSKIVALQKRVAELERVLGQKQLEITFKDKLIELAEQEYGIAIKKNKKRQR